MDVDELRNLLGGQPSKVARDKEIAFLDANCRAFIERSPFFVLATADADGRCDASPKGGPPGFVRVLDEHRLAYGELPGNRRLDSFANAVTRPFAGLLFMVPGVEETLRINGRLAFSQEPELLEAVALDGRAPRLAVVLEVEEAFLHCAKAYKRSRLWQPDEWPPLDGLPSAAAIWRDHASLSVPVDEIEAGLEQGYRESLWWRSETT
jgi:PPOX class probable FMN-dependent enzyme